MFRRCGYQWQTWCRGRVPRGCSTESINLFRYLVFHGVFRQVFRGGVPGGVPGRCSGGVVITGECGAGGVFHRGVPGDVPRRCSTYKKLDEICVYTLLYCNSRKRLCRKGFLLFLTLSGVMTGSLSHDGRCRVRVLPPRGFGIASSCPSKRKT